MKKVATIIYAVGWTQHTSGTQIIRTAAMLQLLLGNVGRAGGGVNALRGHSNIQGATDMAGIFDILPGYLKMPAPGRRRFRDLPEAHRRRPRRSRRSGTRSTTGRTRRSSPSRFLKAMYGDAATKDNDWAFHYLPKIDRNYSWIEIWDDMYTGQRQGDVRLRHERRRRSARTRRRTSTRSRRPTGWSSARSTRTRPASSGARRARRPTR